MMLLLPICDQLAKPLTITASKHSLQSYINLKQLPIFPFSPFTDIDNGFAQYNLAKTLTASSNSNDSCANLLQTVITTVQFSPFFISIWFQAAAKRRKD
jgi:hypothetical protein